MTIPSRFCGAASLLTVLMTASVPGRVLEAVASLRWSGCDASSFGTLEK